MTEPKRGPCGLEGWTGRPVREECDEVMHPFAALEGRYMVEGFGCDACGGSFDTQTTEAASARV